MKTHLIFPAIVTIVAALALASSCDGELDRVRAVRRIINESGVEAYVTVANAVDTVDFTLLLRDTIEFEGTCTYDARRFCDLGWDASSNSTVRFNTEDGIRIWSNDFSTQFADSIRAIGVNPQFEKNGYEARTVDGVIIYTFRILESDIPR